MCDGETSFAALQGSIWFCLNVLIKRGNKCTREKVLILVYWQYKYL